MRNTDFSLIEAASFSPSSIEHPNAWVGHLPFAAWLMKRLNPNIFVELGTHSGNSYFSFCQAAEEAGLSTKCYAVDAWQGDEHAGFYSEEVFHKVNAYNQAHYANFSRLLRMTFDDAVNYFSDGSIELLHIDGLHTYEAVKHDFETWLPKLTPGAVVLFHDTNVRERGFGVWKLWEELQNRYSNNLEFLHSHGLGVLQLDGATEAKVLAWLDSNSVEQQQLKNYFSALGARQLERFELGQTKIQVASLNQGIAERDGQIANLNQGITERDGQIFSLKLAVVERDSQFAKIVVSRSWRLTKPLRWIGRLFRGEFALVKDPLIRWMGGKEPAAAQPPSVSAKEVGSQYEVAPAPIEPTHSPAVIIPVYRGVAMTKRCIEAAMPGVLSIQNAKLLAINDASPDQGMQEMLEQLAEQWPDRMFVLENKENLGFVRTVNRGFAFLKEYDVILLNSDVVVPADWLGRLIEEAYSASNVGTVTPFSNNATICSFPYFLQENVQPFNLNVDVIDAAFKNGKLPCIKAPTGVGFCMYVRRECLSQIGYLNEEKFGRGYGEENDLCQRAIKRDWLNLISPNLYAYHEGSVSFSAEKEALVESAMKVIDELHPNYHADVQQFIQEDPLKNVRITRHVQLLGALSIPKVLHVAHSAGGGVKQHINDLGEYYRDRMANLLLVPQDANGQISLSLGISPYADKLLFSLPADYSGLIALLKEIGISAVHFHHTHGLDEKILHLSADLGVVRLLTVHDYYWMAGNPTLTDENGIFSGHYSDQTNNPMYPLPKGVTVERWQEALYSFVNDADCVIYPSIATKRIFEEVYQPRKGIVVPHIEQHLDVNAPPLTFVQKHHYTIGVLGAIGKEKGADLLEAVAIEAERANLNVSFKLIGYAYRPLSGVDVTGPYDSRNLNKLIREHGLDILFFPAKWPETYSYTLSNAITSGLPIIVPHIGAFPERVSGRLNVLLFDHLSSAPKLLEQISVFIRRMERGETVSAPALQIENQHAKFYQVDYLQLVTKSLKVQEAGNTTDTQTILAQVTSRPHKRQGSAWRLKLVHLLWRLRMNNKLKWLSDAVPHRVRRAIRLALSDGNSDEIAKGARIDR